MIPFIFSSQPYTLNQEIQGRPPESGNTPTPPPSPDYYNYMEPDPYYYRVGFGLRFLAAILDVIMSYALITIALSFTDFNEISQMLLDYANEIQRNPESVEKFILFLQENVFKYYIISFALLLIYYLPEMMFGWSPGKFLVRIKIGSDINNYAMPGQLAIRYLLKHIATITFLFALLLGSFSLMFIPTILGLIVFIAYFFMLTERKQTLYDRMARTAVYRIKELNYLNQNQHNDSNQGIE